MRFLRLDLRAFGPFADAPSIDLSGGSRGFHLIHGPNEAGKSSALRAIRCLLFGFPARTGDDHRHTYKDLRVGASIRDESGTELSFLRRKGDVRTIRKLDDDGLIADETLERFFGVIDRTKFDDLCAMDHAELVSGGLAIIQGKGNLGSILFAAGSGLVRIDEVRKALDVEMDELFKPTGKIPAINAALAELKTARESSEHAMLATSDWVDLDRKLGVERAKKEGIDSQVRLAEIEKRRLERLRDVLPVIGQIDVKIDQLARFVGSPVLSEGFADRRREATGARQAGLKAGLAAQQVLDGLARDLAALGPRDLVLDEADAIRQVRDELGVYRKAIEDRPIEQSRLARREADARSLLLELRPGASLEEADSVRIPTASKERIQGLSQELARLDANYVTAEGEIAKLLAGRPGIEHQAPPRDALRLAEGLGEAIKHAQAPGDLEGQLAQSRAEMAKLERQADVDLRALPFWSGTLEALETLAVPSNATLDRFDADLRAADQQLDQAEAALAKLEVEKAALKREIDRQQLTGPVPTDEDLGARRGLRDEAWRLVRRAWLDRQTVADPARIADGFEAAVRSADELSDHLRKEADAVAAQAQRQWRRRELLDQLATLAEVRDQARNHRAAIQQAWLETWKPLGLEPLPPREMKEWVAIRRTDLVRQAKAIRDRRLELAEKASKIDAIRVELRHHLDRLGDPSADPSESLAALLARAKSTVERVNMAVRLDGARQVLAKAEAARAAAKSQWASAVEPLGRSDDATPSQALAVIARFDDLAVMLREVVELRGKIGDCERVERRFETTTRALLERLGIEAPATSVEVLAREITNQFARAQVVEARREELLKRGEEERSKLDDAATAVDDADAALSTLVFEAGCESTEDLIEAERTSDQIKDLKKELRSLEAQLSTLAGPIPVDRLREQSREADPEMLDLRIADLAEQLAPLELERDRLGEEIGRCRQKLEEMDGGPAAADAQQLVEERVAHLAIDVERYSRLRLASAVLREAVERYRKAHQGPVLDRAGAYFASLTTGSFAGLRADVDDKGEPVLLGVRGDGATLLKVDGMSEGTADQLYLALRLASLQTYLDDHEPMPLVVDDILVNFDNARATAALEALAELSKRTQILFFTHHDHIVDLARVALPEDVLFVHHLSYPPISVATNGRKDGSAVEAGKPKRMKKATSLAEEG